MSLPCSAKHKKPVCDKCTAGTNCTKCCLCQPRSRGRPRKDTLVASDPETAARSNPEREARIHHTTDASASSVLEEAPAITDEAIQYASQAHILKVMGQMGCEDGYESSVRRLPHIDVRRHVQFASELDAASVQRIENVFRRGIKALARMLLPGLNLKSDSDIKIAFSIQSVAAPMEEPAVAEEVNEVPLLPIPSSSIPTQMLDTMPITIRDVLKCKKPYTSLDARTLLVPLADVPQAYIASLLTISNNYAGRLHFQAKVDKLYFTEGVTLQEYRHSRSRVNSTTINLAVDFIYGDDNISRLAWEAKKRSPNRDLR